MTVSYWQQVPDPIRAEHDDVVIGAGEPPIAFALGFSGYGNSIGLVAAERMVELAMDGRDPGPLDVARFGGTGKR
jgi:glycine/D-amino acid oxidase-like deaminating enzyme